MARGTLHAYNWEGQWRVCIAISTVVRNLILNNIYIGVSTQCTSDQSPQALDSAHGTSS
jgi:hypothetical protein